MNSLGTPLAYSLDTTLLPDILINAGDDHYSTAEVVRPQGNVAVFDFQWTGNQFDSTGLPDGWNHLNQARQYVLQTNWPNYGTFDFGWAADPPVASLIFPSGIVQQFLDENLWYLYDTSNSDTESQLTTLVTNREYFPPALQSDGGTDTTDSSKYNLTIHWNSGRITEIDYQTKDGKQTIATTIGYAGSDPADAGAFGTIMSLSKTLNGAPLPALGYSVSADGKSITNGNTIVTETGTFAAGSPYDITLTTTVSGVGGSRKEEFDYNADGLLLNDIVTLTEPDGTVSAPAKTSYQYVDPNDTNHANRYPDNQAAQWGKVAMITFADNSWEGFRYDSDTGWVTSIITPFKNSQWSPSNDQGTDQTGNRVETDGYDASVTGGDAPDTSLLVQPPREVQDFVNGTEVGGSLNRYSAAEDDSNDSNDPLKGDMVPSVLSEPITSGGSPAWSNTSLFSLTLITGFASSWTIGDNGTTRSVDNAKEIVSNVSWGQNPISQLTQTLTPFGAASAITAGALASPAENDSAPASGQDSFGRITQMSLTGGLTRSANYANADGSYSWFGPQSVTEADGSTTKYTYTPLGQVASKTIYAGSSHSVRFDFEYDAAGNMVQQTQAAVDANGNAVAGLAAITNTNQFDALGRLTKEVDNVGGADVTGNRQTTYNYTSTASGTVEDITYPDGSTEEKVTNLDGTLKSDGPIPSSPGTAAVTPSTYDEGVVSSDTYDQDFRLETAGSTWTSVTSGGSSNTTTTFTNMLGEQYLTQQASFGQNGYADSITSFDANRRPTQTIGLDGTMAETVYDPVTGQAATAFTDMDRNGVYDPGIDRNKTVSHPSLATTLAGAAGADDTQDLSDTSVADDNEQTSFGGDPSTYETDTETVDGQTTQTVTSIPSAGTYTKTTASPDGTKTADTYTDGLLTDEQTIGTNGAQITDVSYQYNGLRELTAKTDYTGTTGYTYFSDGTQASITLPGHNPQAVNLIDQHSEATTQATRPDGQTVSTPRNTLGSVGTQSGAGVLPASLGYDLGQTGQMTSLTTYQSGTLGDLSTAAQTSWSYDPSTGKLSTKTFADGSQDVYTYDWAGRLNGVSLPGVSGNSFEYNTAGDLVHSAYLDQNSGWVTSDVFSQDEFGRPLVTTDSDNGKTFTQTTSYTAQEQVASQNFGSAGGATVGYEYGQNGAPPLAVDKTTLDGLAGAVPSVETDYGYYASTRQLSSITVNNLTIYFMYVPGSNQPQEMYAQSVAVYQDPDPSDQARIGTIQAWNEWTGQLAFQDAIPAGQFNQQDQQLTEYLGQTNASSGNYSITRYNYTYDPTRGDALKAVSVNGTPTYSYGLDGVGNFTSNNGITLNLGAPNSVNEYSNLTYNGRGDLTNDGIDSYTYDALDRLIQVTPDNPALAGTQEQYGYDSQGRRLWMDVYVYDQGTGGWDFSYGRRYVWDSNQMTAVLDQNNVLLQQYTYGPMGLAAITDYSADPQNPKTYLAILDTHGNTSELMDPGNYTTGAAPRVVASYQYDPYSRLLSSTGPAAGICIILGKGYMVDAASDPNLGFAPNPDSSIGIDRAFNWQTDTYMQRDPAGPIQGGLNDHEGFGGDPINKVDPSGNDTRTITQVSLEAIAEAKANYGDDWVQNYDWIYKDKVNWYRDRGIDVVVPPEPNGGSSMYYMPPTNGQVVKQYAKEGYNAVATVIATSNNTPFVMANNVLHDWGIDVQVPMPFPKSVYELHNDYNVVLNDAATTERITKVAGVGIGVGLLFFGGISDPAEEVAPTAVPPAATSAELSAPEAETITQPVGDLRAAGLRDAHHVVQDAAVRDLPRYDTDAAPGVRLDGPSTSVGTPHYNATQVQRLPGGGTYGAERAIAYNALRAAGYSDAEAAQAIEEADEYFNSIGVSEDTPTRIPGNRR